MALFEIETPQGAFEVDAPDQATALKALQGMSQEPATPAMDFSKPSEAAMRSPLANLEKSRTQSFGQGFADTGGLGFADEAAAGIGSLISDDSYSDILKEMRDMRAGAADQHPGAFIGGQVTGALAPIATGGAGAPALLSGVARSGAGLGTRMGVGAAAGGLQGGAYGFGSGEGGLENRIASGVGGAVSGALVGGAVPAVASGISSAISKLAGVLNKPAAQITEASLNANKQAAYDLAERAGVIINPNGMRHLADTIKTDLADFGYHPDLQPGATAVLKEIEKQVGNNVTLKGLDVIRKMAGNAYIQGNKSNNAVVSKIVGHIDDLLKSQNPNFMSGLNTAVGVRALGIAREFASRAFKLETAKKLIQKGNQMADRNITDTRVKSVKSQLAKIGDPFSSWGRGFSAAEKAAAEKAARYTPAQRALHGASVLNPFGGGKLSAAGHIAAATVNASTGNIPGLLMQGAGIGMGAGFQKAGEALARKSVNEFVDMVSRGGVPAPVVKNALQLMAEGKRDAITQVLLKAGIVLNPGQLAVGAPAQ